MKNEKRLVIEKSYAIRPESNGMTVYDKKKHKFFFFEGLTAEDGTCTEWIQARNVLTSMKASG